jgi:membrane associated rhomboid family serine protease
MVFLAIFGNNIEDVLGHIKYLFFYLTCGIVAALTQIFSAPDSLVPTLGASGAIAGVLGAYFLLFPRARVNTLVFLGFFITTIRIPAWLLLGFWIISQFFSTWTQSLKTDMVGETGGVAYFAHIGGFIAGMLLIRLLVPRPPRYTPSEL